MKNRSLILGLVAIILATFSAFAIGNNSIAETVYVEIKTTTNVNWHCQSTSLVCTNSGVYLCAVNVTRDLPAPATVVKTNGRTSECVALLNLTEAALNYNPNTISITDVMPFDTNPALLRRSIY